LKSDDAGHGARVIFLTDAICDAAGYQYRISRVSARIYGYSDNSLSLRSFAARLARVCPGIARDHALRLLI
jgi:hypothetical protein